MGRKRRQDMIDAEELTSIIAQADTDGSGRLSMEEFVSRLQDSKFRYFLEFRGLSNKDAMMYFKLLTSTTGESDVDIPTFAGGCLAMRGTASAMDMHALGFEVKIMRDRQREFSNNWDRHIAELKEALTRLNYSQVRLLELVPPLGREGQDPAMERMREDAGAIGASIRKVAAALSPRHSPRHSLRHNP